MEILGWIFLVLLVVGALGWWVLKALAKSFWWGGVGAAR
jgi:hypothetical protein